MFSVEQAARSDWKRTLNRRNQYSLPADLVTASLVLNDLMGRPGCLSNVELQRKTGAFARTLLCGDDQLSVWAIVWDLGAETPIHDHHCSCCFGVISGSLEETSFRAIDETTVVTASRRVRREGHVTCMVPTGPNIHRVVNRGPTEAISLHVYGFDHIIKSTSVHRQYSLAARQGRSVQRLGRHNSQEASLIAR